MGQIRGLSMRGVAVFSLTNIYMSLHKYPYNIIRNISIYIASNVQMSKVHVIVC